MNVSSLTGLLLGENQLTGHIPAEIRNLENLDILDINSNQLSGEIPSDIGNLDSLLWLSLSNNQLIGDIPNEIVNLNRAYLIDLSYNGLSGGIPREIENLDLSYLSLNNNNLSGIIPDNFCDIYLVKLSDNQFCPEYPTCLSEDELGIQDTSNCNNQGYCDINSDGSINVLDVILVVNCVIDSYECDNICMDYNEDSLVNILDIVLMINIIIGI